MPNEDGKPEAKMMECWQSNQGGEIPQKPERLFWTSQSGGCAGAFLHGGGGVGCRAMSVIR